MERVLLTEMAQALGVVSDSLPAVAVTGVSIDSRTIRAGELFVAICGDCHDGHEFVGAAFDRGAVAAVVAESAGIQSAPGPLVRVSDTTDALLTLSGWYRDRSAVRVVAVTGTNGKTTTKDMTAAVLARQWCVAKTQGNYNNHIGVPLTLFGIENRHTAAVVEIGMNHPGEIARLGAAVKPLVGVITNVSEAHIETMHDIETVTQAKGELLDVLDRGGSAILNADDPRVMSQVGRAPANVSTFGLSEDADVRAVGIEVSESGVSFRVEKSDITDSSATIELPVPGRHNVMNALAAIAAGAALGVPVGEAADALSGFEPSPMRMTVLTVGGRTVINDAYNCNPGSLRAALETLVSVGRGRATAAAIGDMLEMGERSEEVHREAGVAAAELGVERLYLYGSEVEALRDGATDRGMSPDRVRTYRDKGALVRDLDRDLAPDGVLLVKGSRGMRMEEVVELLVKETPVS
jgi:UDP-N-acetylmuramoyl-tripeptide--D-alanyl-D-alanine ligase